MLELEAVPVMGKHTVNVLSPASSNHVPQQLNGVVFIVRFVFCGRMDKTILSYIL